MKVIGVSLDTKDVQASITYGVLGPSTGAYKGGVSVVILCLTLFKILNNGGFTTPAERKFWL